jgi:hypothetical protein
MNGRQIAPCFILGGALAIQAGAGVAQTTSTNEMVVGIKDLNPEVVGYVAENGEPRRVSAPAGTDLLKLVSAICGSANARRSYFPLFIAANASNPDIQEKRLQTTKDGVFTLPACLYAEEAVASVTTTNGGPQWRNPRLMAVAKGTDTPPLVAQSIDLDRLAKNASGDSGLPSDLATTTTDPVPPVDFSRLQDLKLVTQYNDLFDSTLASVGFGMSGTNLSRATVDVAKEIEKTLRTQDVWSSNNVKDYSRIPTGQAVTLSAFAPGKYVFTVKAGLDPSVVAKAFPAGALQAGTDIVGVSDYQPYFAIPQSRTAGNPNRNGPNNGDTGNSAQIDCADSGIKPWPVDVEELRRVLQLRQRINRSPKAGRLLILDTGFPSSEVGVDPFRKELFIHKTDSSLGADNEEYLWTATPPPPPNYFFEGLKDSDHGVAVLTLALGGIDMLKSGLLTSDLFPGGFFIMMAGYTANQGQLTLNGSAVVNTLAGTNWGRVEVDVVNMSLRFKTAGAAGNAKDSVVKNRDVLYVFAAGNDDPKGNDLGGKPDIVPAKWGGAASPNVITVGSVDAESTYSNFANFGQEYVDLAAPGCNVPVIGWDAATHSANPTTMSGTSMSAPLVSFAANLLRQDYRNVGRLKARLLVSGRYSAKLAGKVRSSRVLDVALALAVPFDIYRDKDGKAHYGHVQWASLGKEFSGAPVKRDEVRQISSFKPDASNPNSGTLQVAYGGAGSATDVDFRSVQLLRGELSNIQFQEAVDQGGTIGLATATNLNIRNIESITLCQTNECYWTN